VFALVTGATEGLQILWSAVRWVVIAVVHKDRSHQVALRLTALAVGSFAQHPLADP
jgi:hypothetical protein